MNSQVANPIAEFDPEVQKAVDGLLHLGYLTTEVEFAGHSFGLRTLRVEEELAASKAVEPFRNTLKEPEAWMTAQVGLALTHVDGEDDFCPPAGPDRNSFARARFQYMGKWFMPTIEYLFGEFAELLKEQQMAIGAISDLSIRTRPSFSPSADSLTGPGTSSEPTWES